jgi:ribonuclease J
MAFVDGHQPGLFWQSLMGNNSDGIGGNCHRYDVVGEGTPHRWFLVDYGVKFRHGGRGYAVEFASPEGLLARRSDGQVEGGGPIPDGLVLTHAHEDHIGAIRHLLDMGYRVPPVYASAFTAAMLNKSLADAGIARDRWPEMTIVRNGEVVALADARVEFVAVDHMPGATALAIRSEQGCVFHSGDYRFDATLPLGERADPERLRALGKEGIDMVVADSTSAPNRQDPVAEADIQRNLSRLMAANTGRPLIAGILGSQLDRLVSLGRAAHDNGRALAVSGRSLAANVAAAGMAGLDVAAAAGTPILTAAEARALPPGQVLMVTTGAFAQANSGLMRAANRQPGALEITPDTTVIVAQRDIPSSRAAQAAMVAKLERLGARVITAEAAEAQGFGPIHQSGHAVERDVRLMYTLLRPKGLAVPIHGDHRQIQANSRLARSLGIPSMVLDRNGTVIRVGRDGVSVAGAEAVSRVGARERTDGVKQLPRAPRGQGRDSHFAVPAYSYDGLDATGTIVLKPDFCRSPDPLRPKRSNAPEITVTTLAGRRER